MAKSILTLSILFLLGICCTSSPHGVSLQEISGSTMGTYYKVKLANESATDLNQLKKEIDQRLKEFNRQMSTYIADSEISRFNLGNSTKPFKISKDFADTLVKALKVAKLTEGYFDPTLGRIVNLWGFGPLRRQERTPTETEIKEALMDVGIDKISLKYDSAAAGYYLSKVRSSVFLDLSAIAKGYAVDKISEFLTKRKMSNHLVEIGGEIRVAGSKGTKLWTVAIESPSTGSKTPVKMLVLDDSSIATSGNYRNFYEDKGNRYGHTIHRQSGKPVSNKVLSVSVVHDECALADAYATALMAMGSQRGLQFARENQLAAFFVYTDDQDSLKTSASEKWKALQ